MPSSSSRNGEEVVERSQEEVGIQNTRVSALVVDRAGALLPKRRSRCLLTTEIRSRWPELGQSISSVMPAWKFCKDVLATSTFANSSLQSGAAIQLFVQTAAYSLNKPDRRKSSGCALLLHSQAFSSHHRWQTPNAGESHRWYINYKIVVASTQ